MKKCSSTLLATVVTLPLVLLAEWPPSPVVDTGQDRCYDFMQPMDAPHEESAFFGQDAQYQGVQPAYHDNEDGTVTDLVTGLMWSRATDVRKVTLAEARQTASEMTLGGYEDWRVPCVRELYSLIDFRGVTGMMDRGRMNEVPPSAIPYINTDYFDFRYGNIANGERFIDAQWLSSTLNVSTVFGDQEGVFGVNFADGRIKCYPLIDPRTRREKRFYARYVRGRADYARNGFTDNGDGTVTDAATGLIWMQADSAEGMSWAEALEFASELELGGQSDWRLPNAKELLSIVDYSRSPDTTQSAAISPIFDASRIRNEAGNLDFPYYWTSTTHLDGPNARQAVYVSFGRAIGQMHGRIWDVHGAGAQRSDPKVGEPALGHGPQGDGQRVDNYVRCVRGGAILAPASLPAEPNAYPNLVQADGRIYRPEPMIFTERPSPPRGWGPSHDYSRSRHEGKGTHFHGNP